MNYFSMHNPFNKKWTLPLLLFGCLLWLGVGVCAAQTNIVLKDSATIFGPNILLGDVAHVDGIVRDHVEKIKQVKLSIAPPVHVPITMKKSTIEYRIKENKFDDYVVSGASTTTITLATTEVTPDEFVKAAKDYIKNNLEMQSINGTIQLLRQPRSKIVPAREVSVKVREGKLGRLKGNITVYVDIYNGDKFFQSAPVQLSVQTLETFFVASKSIPRGAIILDDDIKMVTEETTKLGEGLVKDKNEIIGKETKFAIKENRPIKSLSITEPRLIKRGDIVKIVVQIGGVSVASTGIAKKDGRMGDIIPVLQNNKRIPLNAKVVGESKVVIEK